MQIACNVIYRYSRILNTSYTVYFYKARNIIHTIIQLIIGSIFVEKLDEFYGIFERYSLFRKSQFECVSR